MLAELACTTILFSEKQASWCVLSKSVFCCRGLGGKKGLSQTEEEAHAKLGRSGPAIQKKAEGQAQSPGLQESGVLGSQLPSLSASSKAGWLFSAAGLLGKS
jgi:hypothetical protein